MVLLCYPEMSRPFLTFSKFDPKTPWGFGISTLYHRLPIRSFWTNLRQNWQSLIRRFLIYTGFLDQSTSQTDNSEHFFPFY
uniref:Uncharacterized protein n=1 Tax=Caenorhabditis japonica TaxID=281687 RepID=A0A8R1ECE4_CAEJA